MNPVVQRLALRAMPNPGGVRPRIASRFDWSAPAPLALPAAETAPGEQAAAPASHARTSRIPRARGPSPSHIDELPQRPSPKPDATDQASAITSAQAPDPDTPPDTISAHDSVVAEPPANRKRPSRLAQPPEGTPVPSHSVTETLLLPDLAAPTEPAFVLSMPAGPEAQRSPPEHRGEPALPDIHVTIGRIDIVAEREQRAPPLAAPAPRPKLMSLEDYLAKGRSRR